MNRLLVPLVAIALLPASAPGKDLAFSTIDGAEPLNVVNWEYNYPHTPTTFALRTPRYKFIQYHGIWDIDELYDLETDPHEERNLIFDKEHQPRITQMRAGLHEILADSDAARVPFSHKRRMGSNLRLKSGSKPADFPPQLMREKNGRE